MRKYSLFLVIFIIFGFLAGVFEVQTYLTSLNQKEKLIEEHIDARLQTLQVLDRTIFSPAWHFRRVVEPLLTQAFINQVAELPDVNSIVVTDASGSVFLESGDGLGSLEAEKENILNSMSDNHVYHRDAKLDGKSVHFLVYKGEFERYFWLIFDQAEIDQAVADLVRQNTIIGLLWLVIFGGIFFVIVSVILKPLTQLRDLFNEVRAGNLNVKAEVKSQTEIGELASTFNLMVEDLRKSKEGLEEAKAALEIKVAARTRELKDFIDGLEIEVQRRTKEVYDRMKELEKFQNLAVGRELKMIELKKEIRNIKEGAKKEDDPSARVNQ